jgi:hypothetical protein
MLLDYQKRAEHKTNHNRNCRRHTIYSFDFDFLEYVFPTIMQHHRLLLSNVVKRRLAQ